MTRTFLMMYWPVIVGTSADCQVSSGTSTNGAQATVMCTISRAIVKRTIRGIRPSGHRRIRQFGAGNALSIELIESVFRLRPSAWERRRVSRLRGSPDEIEIVEQRHFNPAHSCPAQMRA